MEEVTYTTAVKEAKSIAKSLTHRKSQKSLLLTGCNDLHTSLRSKIGRVFNTTTFEQRKSDRLEECTRDMVKIGLDEATQDVLNLLKQKLYCLKIAKQP